MGTGCARTKLSMTSRFAFSPASARSIIRPRSQRRRARKDTAADLRTRQSGTGAPYRRISARPVNEGAERPVNEDAEHRMFSVMVSARVFAAVQAVMLGKPNLTSIPSWMRHDVDIESSTAIVHQRRTNLISSQHSKNCHTPPKELHRHLAPPDSVLGHLTRMRQQCPKGKMASTVSSKADCYPVSTRVRRRFERADSKVSSSSWKARSN